MFAVQASLDETLAALKKDSRMLSSSNRYGRWGGLLLAAEGALQRLADELAADQQHANMINELIDAHRRIAELEQSTN